MRVIIRLNLQLRPDVQPPRTQGPAPGDAVESTSPDMGESAAQAPPLSQNPTRRGASGAAGGRGKSSVSKGPGKAANVAIIRTVGRPGLWDVAAPL